MIDSAGPEESPFWQTPQAELTRQLGADLNGLTSAEAAARLSAMAPIGWTPTAAIPSAQDSEPLS